MQDPEPGPAAQQCRVGIIGGGQLGWMLCRAARELHMETIVLTPQAECPAAAQADRLLIGTLDDTDIAARLADAADVITFEIEAVAPAVLELLASRVESCSVQVHPAPDVLLLLQNKLRQKLWLEKHGFPTATFMAGAGTPDDAMAAGRLGLPLVQKAATGGYDGRGVQIIRDTSSLERLWPVPAVLEAFVADAIELAVVVARAADGSLATYQPASMCFHTEGNVLDTVSAPAAISRDQADRAMRLAEDIVDRLDGVGVFSIEMFLTARDELLVNEISPRVHNAGHLTVEACETSQFEQHLRAVTGMALRSSDQHRAAAMKNLLFDAGLAHLCGRAPSRSVSDDAGVAVYWYGKLNGTPRRKMGHITALADTPSAAEHRASSASDRLCNPPLGALA
ncbi:MAG: 5-(carboxyamino)imidazole ribonucleotide synthase [Gammaproteobacteria bacterium]|nr:5-(carboxyamino)imidazole ribonucleotide synthase [Gammaproteobacteria bacterium]